MKFYLLTFLNSSGNLCTRNIVAPNEKIALDYLKDYKGTTFLSLIMKLE